MIDHLIQPASVATFCSGDKEIFSMHKSGSIVANDLEFASEQLEIRSKIYGLPTSNTFGYRLKFTSTEIGIFRCQHRIMEWFDNNGQRRLICARSGMQPLAESNDYHIEAREFATRELARKDGELVREALTAWDALYQLGLNFSFEDTGPTDSRQELVRSIAENGTTPMNIDGLHVFDEKIGISEFICSSPVAFDATFDIKLVLKSLNELLTQHFVLSEGTALAVELVRSAVKEPSNAASFILTFSALESLTTKSEEKSTKEKKTVRSMHCSSFSVRSTPEDNSVAGVIAQ